MEKHSDFEDMMNGIKRVLSFSECRTLREIYDSLVEEINNLHTKIDEKEENGENT